MNILDMFKEDNGQPSTMRFMTVLIPTVILANWTMVNYMNRTIVPLDPTLVTVLLGTIGMKVAQKWGGEAKKTSIEAPEPEKPGETT